MNSNEENILYLRNRKGFIKYALKYNYKIQPVFTFGENKTYYTWHRFKKIGLILNKLKLPGIIFWSKYLIIPVYNCILFMIELKCEININSRKVNNIALNR